MKFLNKIASIIFLLSIKSLVAEEPSYSSLMFERQNIKQETTLYDKDLILLKYDEAPRVVHYISFLKETIYQDTAILFTYKKNNVNSATFISNYDKYKHHKMSKSKHGVWYYLLTSKKFQYKIPQVKQLQYKFIINNIYTHDKNNKNYLLNETGEILSIVDFPQQISHYQTGIFIQKIKNSRRKNILFRIYAPQAKKVQVIGNFNSWNKKFDSLKKIDNDYFQISKELLPGEYYYLFVVDGEKRVYPSQNTYKQHPIFGLVSYIKIK